MSDTTTMLEPSDTVALDHADPASRSGRSARPTRTRTVTVRRPRRYHAWTTAAIAIFTTVLYTWNLAAVGAGNSYYAAAVKSASVSWKAWFFGSLDAGSFITVDKPPAAMWVMGLSARLFGYSTWSMLVPEALAGVASVLVLHHLVRRWRGDVAAHLAALAFAVTPVAALMFRYNNPDAILTLLGLLGAWALWKAIETGRTKPLLLAALATGFAFNTKMLQAFLVVPALVLTYLIAGPPKLGRRIAQLGAALLALVLASSWWAVAVWLWPASARPYIGSTSNNSIWSLVLGYNGFARIFGSSGGAPGGGGSGFGGTRGWLRLFNTEIGGQVAWLIPLAVAGLLAGLWLTRRAPRTDRDRAGWLLWGTWAATCAAVFSLSKGIFHAYYTVQLAPAIAALAAAGAIALWELGRRAPMLRCALPAAIVATAGLDIALLRRTPTFTPWLRGTIACAVGLGVLAVYVAPFARRRALIVIGGVVLTCALLAGPFAYAATTIAHPETGSIVLAGPATATGVFGGGFGGANATSTTEVRSLVKWLKAHRGSAKYLVGAFSSQSSAPIIIESGDAVITIGGFSGNDPAPTLAEFERLVAKGEVRYILVDSNGGRGGPGASGSSSGIAAWAQQHGAAVSSSTTGASSLGTLYDLSMAAT